MKFCKKTSKAIPLSLLALAGTSLIDSVSYARAELNFDTSEKILTADPGELNTRRITVTNVGDSDATDLDTSRLFQFSNLSNSVLYQGYPYGCAGKTLVPNASCEIRVNFKPETPNINQIENFYVYYNDNNDRKLIKAPLRLISTTNPSPFRKQGAMTKNLEFVDGDSVGESVVPGEHWDFNDVTIIPDNENKACFTLKNKTPRSFQSLGVLVRHNTDLSSRIKTDQVEAFSDQKYCLEGYSSSDINQLSYTLETLPNPYFNIGIKGYYSYNRDQGDYGYGYFTKQQKEMLNKSLVNLHFVLNGEIFKRKLIDRLSDDNKAQADELVASLRSASKKFRPFMLTKGGAEGNTNTSSDWFSIHIWRYSNYDLLIGTLAHEIAHHYSNDHGIVYSIGYAADDTANEYYRLGIFKKDQIYYEK